MKLNKTFFIKSLLYLFLGGLLLIIAGNIWVIQSTKDSIYYSSEQVPENVTALVLGTSKYYRSGKENLFFRYRIDAAARLYRQGKIKSILLSGDSSTYYNEPKTMKRELMTLGVPGNVVKMDNYGFRTFDSVLRSKLVFKEKDLTIITQDFYAHRALFICKKSGINAIAFATKHVPGSYSFYTLGREYLSRCKAIVDLYILNKHPRYMGDA